MNRPVSALRNLGPQADAAFARAGVCSAGALIALGADAAYARLLATGVRPHFAMYRAPSFAIEDPHWTELGPEEKAALRARFDAVVAAARPVAATALEFELDRLGLPAQPTSSSPEKK
jgi:hypothetical protein